MNKEVLPARSYWFQLFAIRAAVGAMLLWGWTLSGCGTTPATARIALVPDGPEEWTEQLEEAVGYWNDSLFVPCGKVFELDTSEDALPVRLYDDGWLEPPNVLGFYDGEEIGVKATRPDVERATLVHELGHVFLLDHTLPKDDPDTVMCPYIRPAHFIPSVGDVARAARALGC